MGKNSEVAFVELKIIFLQPQKNNKHSLSQLNFHFSFPRIETKCPGPVQGNMGGSVISASVINEEHFFLSLALLFLLLLSVSFIPACPLSSFFFILDSIFSLFYWCFSLTLFKVNQNIESLIKGSVIVGAGAGAAGGGGGGGVGSSSRGGEGVLYQEVMQPRRQSSCGGGGSSCSDNNFYNPFADRNSCSSQNRHSIVNMPDSALSPLNDALSSSPPTKSPWFAHVNLRPSFEDKNIQKTVGYSPNVLIGSLVREEGHIYSLAASGDLLYTGSDSKNIRVWKNQEEFSGFKSQSGLVKAIVIAGDKILSGHQDGKIRIWKVSSKNSSIHKRVGTLPTFKDYIKNSMKPGNYVEVRRHKNTVWLKHFDAISCLSLSEDQTLLYSASWDKTFKVWRISDSKCLESVTAHDDAVNSLVVGWDGLIFTGSADGTVKVWRRELQGKGTKHFYSQTLLKQECAVTALAVNPQATHIYSGSSDGVVNFWRREKHLASGGALRGHKLAVLCLVTAGNLVFSGSADMGICVWRRMGSDHICLSLLMGHTGPVKCLAAEKDLDSPPNETRWTLYSGSLDKSVKMWRVSEDAPPMDWTGNGSSCAMPTTSVPSMSSRGRGRQEDLH